MQKEREAYEVAVEDGKFMYKQRRQLLDTSEGSKDAKWIFVLSTSKTLYVGQVFFIILPLKIKFFDPIGCLSDFIFFIIAEEERNISALQFPCWRCHICCWEISSRKWSFEGINLISRKLAPIS